MFRRTITLNHNRILLRHAVSFAILSIEKPLNAGVCRRAQQLAAKVAGEPDAILPGTYVALHVAHVTATQAAGVVARTAAAMQASTLPPLQDRSHNPHRRSSTADTSASISDVVTNRVKRFLIRTSLHKLHSRSQI